MYSVVTSAGLMLPLDIIAATAWHAPVCLEPPIREEVIAVTSSPLQYNSGGPVDSKSLLEITKDTSNQNIVILCHAKYITSEPT